MRPDPQDMIDWQRYEQTGRWPDTVYTPTEEHLMDPDHHEVAELIHEQYAHDNARRREREMRGTIEALRGALEAQGVDPDEVLYGKD